MGIKTKDDEKEMKGSDEAKQDDENIKTKLEKTETETVQDTLKEVDLPNSKETDGSISEDKTTKNGEIIEKVPEEIVQGSQSKIEKEGGLKDGENVDAEYTLNIIEDEEVELEVVNVEIAKSEDSTKKDDVIREKILQPEESIEEPGDILKKTEEQRVQKEEIDSTERNNVFDTEEVLATAIDSSAPATGEVVEETPLSVKEQIAAFSNMKIQETHGQPKPGVANAFSKRPVAAEQPVQTELLQESSPDAKPRNFVPYSVNEEVFRNPQPKPFSPVEFVETCAPTAHANQVPNNEKLIVYDMKQDVGENEYRIQTHPMVQQYKSAAKLTPMQPTQTQRPVPIRNIVNQSEKINESRSSFEKVYAEPKSQTTPESFKSPAKFPYAIKDDFTISSGSSVTIRLRRNSPDIPWGFAVFGGTDYDCPPFISRVAHHSLAGQAGLEIGDIVVSICGQTIRGRKHDQIKAEILRAGNELDFTIIKQGISKDAVSMKAYQTRQDTAPISQSRNYSGAEIYATSETPQRMQQSYTQQQIYKKPETCRPIRTKSLRLLDEHLEKMASKSRFETKQQVFTTPSYQVTQSEEAKSSQRYYSTPTSVQTKPQYVVHVKSSKPQYMYTEQARYNVAPVPQMHASHEYHNKSLFASEPEQVRYVQYSPSERTPVRTTHMTDSCEFNKTYQQNVISDSYGGSQYASSANRYARPQIYPSSLNQSFHTGSERTKYDEDAKWSTVGSVQTTNSCWM